MKKIIQTTEYKRALVYCRVSSERQVNEGHGLDSQEARCFQKAQDLNLPIAEVFRDAAISGGLFQRPAMNKLIAFLDKHPNEKFVVIFDDLKRFARDVQVHMLLKTELVRKRKVRLECLNFKFEESPTGRFIEVVMAAGAQLEREQNKEQVVNKMKARLEAGFWAFCPPPGLKFVKDGTKGQILRPNAPQAVIFKQAIEKYRDFELNTLEEMQEFILSQYKLLGINKTLSLNGVKRILTNVLYAGCIIYEPWDIPLKKNAHEGFISYETYLAVQDRLKNSSRPRIRQDQSKDFPLRNYVLCCACRKEMTAAWFKGRKEMYGYYLCKQKGCPMSNKIYKAGKIEGDFLERLYGNLPSREIINLAEQVIIDLWESKRKNETQIKAGVEAQIKNLEEKNKTLMERITKTSNDGLVVEYERVIANNVAEIKNLQKELNKTKYSQDGFQTAVRVVFDYLANPTEQWESRNYARQRLLLGMLFEEKLVYNRFTGFQTAQIPFMHRIIGTKIRSKIHLVEMPGVKPGSKRYQDKN